MQLVNRAAITVTPKRPYIDWANSLDDDGPRIGPDHLPERSVYLVKDIGDYSGEMETIVRRYYRKIFEHELIAWHRVKSEWPQKRDFATFTQWFDAEVHSMILDLHTGQIETEPYEEL